MELEDFRNRGKRHKAESGANPGLGPSGDEELDIGYLAHETGEDRQDGGHGFFVPAFVECVDDDEGRDAGSFKWANDSLLHLGGEGLSSDIRVYFQDLEQHLSEKWIPEGKLEGECWEYRLKVAPVLEVS